MLGSNLVFIIAIALFILAFVIKKAVKIAKTLLLLIFVGIIIYNFTSGDGMNSVDKPSFDILELFNKE